MPTCSCNVRGTMQTSDVLTLVSCKSFARHFGVCRSLCAWCVSSASRCTAGFRLSCLCPSPRALSPRAPPLLPCPRVVRDKPRIWSGWALSVAVRSHPPPRRCAQTILFHNNRRMCAKYMYSGRKWAGLLLVCCTCLRRARTTTTSLQPRKTMREQGSENPGHYGHLYLCG